MIKKLTDRYLQTLKPPAVGRLVIVDSEAKGLTLRLAAGGGVKSWSVRYRVRGQPQRTFTLPSRYPTTSLAEARRRAEAIRTAARDGRDLPDEEERAAEAREKAAASARTVRELAAEFIESYAKTNHRRWKVTQQRIGNHVLPRLGARAAASVRRTDVAELLDHLEREKGLGAQVNRTRTTLSSMFTFAIEREIVASNPVAGVRRRREVERTRTLSDAELRAVWGALNKMPEPGASFVRALMLTAARRDEVRCMQWSEIDAESGLLTVPAARTKTQKDHEIPLTPNMIELLAGLPRLGPSVFTVSGERAWGAHGKFKADLDKKSGVANWRFHDIRRTVRSRLAEAGVPFEIAERVLGHSVSKLERVYNRHSYRQEKARALQAWADRLLAIVGDGYAAPNVLSMERAKAWNPVDAARVAPDMAGSAPAFPVDDHRMPSGGRAMTASSNKSETPGDLSSAEIAEIAANYVNPFRVADGLDKSSDPFSGLFTPGTAPDLMPDGSVNPYAGKDSEAEAQADRKERKRREAEFKQNLAPLMSQRAHFSGDEIAKEVGRRATDYHGHLATKPEPEDRRRVLEQLRDAILADYFNDAQGQSTVILLGAVFSSADFLGALDSFPEGQTFLEFYLEPAYLPRAAVGRWLRDHRYAWPVGWGPDPTLETDEESRQRQQPASAPAVHPAVSVPDADGGHAKQVHTGANSKLTHKIPDAKADEMRSIYRRVHKIRDAKWRDRDSWPSGNIMASYVRQTAAERDRHSSGQDVKIRVGDRALAQICDETYPAHTFQDYLRLRNG
jgi:integrase